MTRRPRRSPREEVRDAASLCAMGLVAVGLLGYLVAGPAISAALFPFIAAAMVAIVFPDVFT